MFDTFSNWVSGGILGLLPWWCYLLWGYITTRLILWSVTIYLHRFRAHKALILDSRIQLFFRFILWLFTGMIEEEWVRIHRKHHKFSDKPGDPHSPHVQGRWIFPFGVYAYVVAARMPSLYKDKSLGEGIADDRWEHEFFRKYFSIPQYLFFGKRKYIGGLPVSLLVQTLLFGIPGILLWFVQIFWIPFWAAGVINGLGHWMGFRTFAVDDRSTNLWWTFLFGGVGGEQHHNNHHGDPTSAKLSVKWYEFDSGWVVIWLLERLGLASVKRGRPKLKRLKGKAYCDEETLKAVVAFRYELVARWDKMAKRIGRNMETSKEELSHLKRELTRVWEDKKLASPEAILHQLNEARRRLVENSHTKVQAFGKALGEYALKHPVYRRKEKARP